MSGFTKQVTDGSVQPEMEKKRIMTSLCEGEMMSHLLPLLMLLLSVVMLVGVVTAAVVSHPILPFGR